MDVDVIAAADAAAAAAVAAAVDAAAVKRCHGELYGRNSRILTFSCLRLWLKMKCLNKVVLDCLCS